MVISWGRRGSRDRPAGSSVLEVDIVAASEGSRVDKVHSGLPARELERHVLGWRHYLERLASVGAGLAVAPQSTPGHLREGAD